MTNREVFLRHVGQTSPEPLALDIVRAEGSKMWDSEGREYIDLIGGISVCNVGHRHPEVLKAIREQMDSYLHVMVYGELVQSPQTRYAQLLVNTLPSTLNSVFFTASGTEATEGAMKLAKRYTGRTGIAAFNRSYHGSTQGSLSILGDEYWRNAYRPLLPDIKHLEYNSFASLEAIDSNTACVIAETVQAEAGVLVPTGDWIKALREKCDAVGCLLVLDEIQCGFGRNGSVWAFEQFGIVPDILLLGKALGGGMPLGAFIADKELMNVLTHDPVLGHINTFGGHPVCCAAGEAAMLALMREDMLGGIKEKEALFKKLLVHPAIKNIRSLGLMMALEFESADFARKVIDGCIKAGVFTDWFLFAPHCIRIVPPLTISNDEITEACERIVRVCESVRV